MIRTYKVVGILSGCALGLGFYGTPTAIAEMRAAPTYVTFDVPGATFTTPESINDDDVVAGYFATQAQAHGFVRTPDGTIISFDPPGSTATFALSINSVGKITGYYLDSTSSAHGFLRAAGGGITSFDVPGSTSTTAQSINSHGVIAGYYNAPGVVHGFTRAADGTFTSFDVPRATETWPQSINNLGAITGTYGVAGDRIYGFMRASDGTITTFDALGSAGYVSAINNKGVVLGHTATSAYDGDGFVRAPDGTITNFDVVGAVATYPTDINSLNAIAGYSKTQKGAPAKGFVRGSGGNIIGFYVPPGMNSTYTAGINNKGVITGIYVNANNCVCHHGFIRIPNP
jgi:hypothetical protein